MSWYNAPSSSGGTGTGISSIALTGNSPLLITGSPLTSNGTLGVTLGAASATAHGYLTSGDWSTFAAGGNASLSGVVSVLETNGGRTFFTTDADNNFSRGESLTNAVAAAVSGDVILLENGDYYLGNATISLVGVSLIGRDPELCYIWNTHASISTLTMNGGTLSNVRIANANATGPAVQVTGVNVDNCIISGYQGLNAYGTWSLRNSQVESTTSIACVGRANSVGIITNTRLTSSANAAFYGYSSTFATIEDCRLVGVDRAIAGDDCQVTVYDSYLQGGTNGAILITNALYVQKFYNTTIIGTNGTYYPIAGGNVARTYELYHCTVSGASDKSIDTTACTVRMDRDTQLFGRTTGTNLSIYSSPINLMNVPTAQLSTNMPSHTGANVLTGGTVTTGTMVFNSTTNVPAFYNGTSWVDIGGSSAPTGLIIRTVVTNGQQYAHSPAADTNNARGDALLAALTASADGDDIYIAPGTYSFTGTAIITYGWNVRGAGVGVTTIEANNQLGLISNVRVKFSNLTISSTGTNTLFLQNSASQVHFNNVKVICNNASSPVSTTAGSHISGNNVEFIINRIGVTNATATAFFNRCSFVSYSGSDTTTLVRLSAVNTTPITFKDCRIVSPVGIAVSGVSGNTALFIDSYISGGLAGITGIGNFQLANSIVNSVAPLSTVTYTQPNLSTHASNGLGVAGQLIYNSTSGVPMYHDGANWNGLYPRGYTYGSYFLPAVTWSGFNVTNLATGGYTTMYTVPTGYNAIVERVRIKSANALHVLQWQVTDEGTAYSLGYSSSATNGDVEGRFPIVFTGGQVIAVRPSVVTPPVSYAVTGVSISASIIAFPTGSALKTSWTLNYVSGLNILYTCPVGKVARLHVVDDAQDYTLRVTNKTNITPSQWGVYYLPTTGTAIEEQYRMSQIASLLPSLSGEWDYAKLGGMLTAGMCVAMQVTNDVSGVAMVSLQEYPA